MLYFGICRFLPVLVFQGLLLFYNIEVPGLGSYRCHIRIGFGEDMGSYRYKDGYIQVYRDRPINLFIGSLM